MINLRRVTAVAAAALGLAFGVLAAPASAVAQNAAQSPQLQASTSGMQTTLFEVTAAYGSTAMLAPFGTDTLKDQSVSPNFTACPVSQFGYGGEAICNTQALGVYSNGTLVEVFVIGTDWSIWHAWPRSNGWHSLGGQAQHVTGPGSGVFLWSSSPYAIWVHGNDSAGTQYCDNWGIPAWGGWHIC